MFSFKARLGNFPGLFSMQLKWIKRGCGKTVKKDKISFHMESDIQQHIAIGSLALGLNLTQDNIEKFIIYLKMINSYQNRINITSITEPYDIISKHFLDSLSSLKLINQELLNYDQGKRIKIIDVGSGAGFPGLPLKIVLPKVSMVLLEARGNRVMFLNDVVDSLELKDTKIIKDRAENIGKMAEYRENFHIVLSRAVAPLLFYVNIAFLYVRLKVP